ncbi:MAG: hypothetical protein MUE34_13405, partial [Acidimicrobiales bacterium]|nr:hypothetical protein [Acidimicrobiales bacterium]
MGERELVDDLRVLRSLLIRAAGVVGNDPSQFPSQIVGRLRGTTGSAGIDRLRAGAMETPGPWLLPRAGSLGIAGPLVVEVAAQGGRIDAFASTTDGRTTVTGSADGGLRVWDLGRGVAVAVLLAHDGRVGAVTVSADGATAVSGGVDATVRVWDLLRRRCTATLLGHRAPVLAVAI